MVIILGNLPKDVSEQDISDLMRHYKPSKITFFDKTSNHSLYECMITIDVNNPISGVVIEQHFNNYFWKDVCISAHHLIF